jgi:hypothetical protein
VQGTYDLVADSDTSRLIQAIPHIIIPLKTALDSRDAEIVGTICKVMQALVTANAPTKVGMVLVPFYRQLLPVLNIFKSRNINLLDCHDYSQRKMVCLGDLIQETLESLERTGGQDAFVNIKYMIPTYESINTTII